MIDAQVPISNEEVKIKWVVRGLANHHTYGQLDSYWRASGLPSTISELEAIISNEEAEVESALGMDGQLQALLLQVNNRPNNTYNAPQQNNNLTNPPPAQNNPPQQQYRGRGRCPWRKRERPWKKQ